MRLSVFLSFSTILASFAAEAAEPITPPQDEMVVTASRAPLPRAQVGSSISTLAAPELELRQYQFALDAIGSLPGVTINQNGAFGGSGSVRIRGASDLHTLVRIDGVVVNDPSTPGVSYNFANLDAFDIDRIEVLRGPQSVLYGSQAMGGVVNIITRRGDGPFSLNGFAEGGSYGALRGALAASGKQDRIDYRLSAHGLTTDGISKADSRDGNTEKDGYDNYGFEAHVGAGLTEGLRLEGVARYDDSEAEYDGYGVATGVEDADEVGKTKEKLFAGRAHFDLWGGRFQNHVGVEYQKTHRKNFSDGLESYDATGDRLKFDYQGDLHISEQFLLIAGAETENAGIDSAAAVEKIRTNSVYGLAQLTPLAGLSLSAGLRYDDHETFGGETTVRLTGAYDLSETGTIFRASWGEAFKAPSPFQLNFFCCGATAPNRNLQPEQGDGWDIGVEQALLDNRLRLQATYFRQVTDDMIDFDFAIGGYKNIAHTRSKGYELEAELELAAWLNIDANYSHIAAIDRDTGFQLTRVPRDSATVTATLRPMEDLSLSVGGAYNGAKQDLRGEVASWFRLDVRAAYDLTDDIQVFGRVENAFDEHYQQVYGYGAPGLSAYAGLRFRI